MRSFIIVNVVKCNHDGIEHVCYEHTNCEQEVCIEHVHCELVCCKSDDREPECCDHDDIEYEKMFPSMIFRHPK